MTGGRPFWRRGFDIAERTVGGPLEELVSTRCFNDVLVVARRAQTALHGAFDRQTQVWLHFWNLPTRSDVSSLRRQVGLLTADERELAVRLEDERREIQRAGKEPDGSSAAASRTNKPARGDS
jgi:hypothetical protein